MPRPSLSALAASRAGDLFTWDWNSTSTPAGLTLARTGTVYQISNTAQSTLQSFGANTWDYEVSPGGDAWIYVLPGYTNVVPDSRSFGTANWITAGTVTGGQSSPDGTSNAAHVTVASGGYGLAESSQSNSATWTAASVWVRAASGSETPGVNVFNYPSTARSFDNGSVSTTWQRRTILNVTAGEATALVPVDGRDWSGSGGLAAGARDVYVDFALRVPNLHFVPPFTAGTVGAKFLSTAGSNLVCPSGYFDVSITGVISLEDESAGASDRYVLYLDANNHLRIRASDDKWVLTIGGVAVLAVTLGYGAQDLGEIRVWSRSDSCGFWLPNMDPANTAAAQAPISVPATSYLLSDGSASASVWPVQLYGRYLSGQLCRARNV